MWFAELPKPEVMEVEKLEEPDKISEKVPVESEPVARQSRPLAFWPSRTQGLLPLWSLPMPSRMSLVRVPRWPPMPSRLAIAEVKLAIEGTDGEKRSELAPAERTSRIAAQKARLCGYDLTGTIEVAHSCYTYVGTMNADSPFYLEPHKFITRVQEISHERPGKEIVLDASKLTVRDKSSFHRMQIQNELQLAFTRRSLACHLMGVITFRVQENWHKFSMDRLAESPPPTSGGSRWSKCSVLRAFWPGMAKAC